MKTPHPHADILRAIVEDKDTEIEIGSSSFGWSATDFGFMVKHPDFIYRIKPKPFIVNGVECPRPVEKSIEVTSTRWPALKIETYPSKNIPMSFGKTREFYFANDTDLMVTFNAMILPFEEFR